ncbi:hypothetical protein [Cryobacterium frigoriphilum]|uniref:hypothetical protein n=1 Tax=Cryobacterium frigoriphilum TaxID=1259150 RepID=UPI003B96F20E
MASGGGVGVGVGVGVGENDPMTGREALDIRVDPVRNASKHRGPRRISADDSVVTVLVFPTNEELEIARQTLARI